MSNAATYGSATAPIGVRSELSGAVATLSVHNEGPAIPAEVLDTVFEPMVRGMPGRNAVRSVGLGLFIVNEFAKAHGGSMSVTSTAEEGTTFALQFLHA